MPENTTEDWERAEANYRAVFDAANDAIFVQDLKSRAVLDLNAAGRAMFGYSPEEVRGLTVAELSADVPPYTRELAAQYLDRAARGEPQLFEWMAKDRNGRTFWVEVNLKRADIGGEGRLLAVVRDISERKRVEERLRGQEELVRLFVKHTPAAVAMFDCDMRYVMVSDRWLSDYHLTGGDIIGKTHYEVFPEVPERWKEIHRRALAGSVERAEEDRFDRADGSVDWLRWEIHPWRRSGGEIGGIIMFTEVITGRKQAEEDLRRSEERFRTLGEFAPVAIFLMDGELRCTYVNARWEEITGRPGEFGMGYGWLDTAHPEDRPRIEAAVRKTAGRWSEWSGDVRVLTPTGEIRWVSARGKPVGRRDGAPTGYVGTLEDITERRRAAEELEQSLQREQAARAEAQEANAAKDHFITVLSHELRNPLTPILAGTSVLRHAVPGDERVRRTVDAIERSAKLEARLVDDLLDLSRIARGKIRLQRTPVALDQVVSAAIQAQQSEAEKAGLTLHVDAAPALWVRGDPDRLQQIVVNLLSNAIKFTPPPGEIRVRVERDGANGLITVEDTGAGISADLLPHLFKIFQQGETGGKRAQGLGIGLSLVKSFAEVHGGHVRAESEGPGKGSRFTVELPLIEAPGIPREADGRSQMDGHVEALLVEDNPDTLELLKESLEILGYRVRGALSAEEALALMEHWRPDIILSDIGLPGMDGYEFLRRARRLPALAKVPALALTGWGQPEDVRCAEDAGYAGHLTKPVDVETLDRRVRECLS